MGGGSCCNFPHSSQVHSQDHSNARQLLYVPQRAITFYANRTLCSHVSGIVIVFFLFFSMRCAAGVCVDLCEGTHIQMHSRIACTEMAARRLRKNSIASGEFIKLFPYLGTHIDGQEVHHYIAVGRSSSSIPGGKTIQRRCQGCLYNVIQRPGRSSPYQKEKINACFATRFFRIESKKA